MRQMKDSGIEWIGQIPQTWDEHPIYYYFAERKNKNIFGQEQNLLSLSYGKIIRKDINSTEGLLPENYNGYNIVYAGDIVMRLTDLQNDQRSLRTGLVYEKGIVTSAYVTLRPKMDLDSRYFHYLLHTFDVLKVFYNMGNGVRQGLNFAQLSKCKLIAPPLAEQERIAGFLDAKCAEVDALAGEIKEQIATLEEYKRSVITEAVTKGLDASVPMKDSGIEWIGEIPQSWDANRLRNLIVRREGGVWGLEPDDYEQGTICLRVADFNFGKGRFVEDNIDAFTKRKYSYAQILKYKLKKGDILIEKSGGGEKTPVGRAVLFDKVFTALFANFMDRLRFNNEIVNPYFIEYWLRAWYYCGASPYYINQTIGIQNINLSLMLAKQIIFYPSLAEQERIAEFLDAKCAKVDALISEKQNQLATLEEYKKSVIFEYVTGKKEVV